MGCLERSLAQNPQILRKTAEGQVAMFCAAHQQMQIMFPRTTDRPVHLDGFASDPGSRAGRLRLCESCRVEIGNAVVDRSDRKSVVSGKSVSGRVDLGGRRIIKTKKHRKNKKNR